jgi:hypothetical protein
LRRFNRHAASLATLLAVTWASPVSAQIAPIVTTLPAPPVPGGPLSQSLNGAYRAILHAGTVNPGAAQQASFLYAQARERALRGDVSGALASAAAAQATAGVPARAAIAALQSTTEAASVTPPAAALPIVDSAALLPADLLVARNEIELAEKVRPGASLVEAKRRYRSALDAYLSGNAAKSASEARASFDAAAEVFSQAK